MVLLSLKLFPKAYGSVVESKTFFEGIGLVFTVGRWWLSTPKLLADFIRATQVYLRQLSAWPSSLSILGSQPTTCQDI